MEGEGLILDWPRLLFGYLGDMLLLGYFDDMLLPGFWGDILFLD